MPRRLVRVVSAIAVLAGLSLLAGCFLPIATGAPQPARTVGKGKWAFNFSSELPTLNLIADDRDTSGSEPGQESQPDDLVAPANSMNLGASVGLTNHIDLELNVEGAMLFFIVPFPLGVSGGVRAHVIHNDYIDLGVAARVGYLGLTVSDVGADSTDDSDEDHADATYGALSAVLQLNPNGIARPGIAIQEMPASIDLDLAGEEPSTFRGVASSVTILCEFATARLSITPFITFTTFDSDKLDPARFVSGGISFSRRENQRAQSVMYVAPPAPGPNVPAAQPQPPPPPAREPSPERR